MTLDGDVDRVRGVLRRDAKVDPQQRAVARRLVQDHLIRRRADVPGYRLARHHPGEWTADALAADEIVSVRVGDADAADGQHALERAGEDLNLGDPLVGAVALPIAVVIEEDEALEEKLRRLRPRQAEIGDEEAGKGAVVQADDEHL